MDTSTFFYILNHFRFFNFQTVPEFSRYWLSQNFYVSDKPRIAKLWTILFKIYTFWTIADFYAFCTISGFYILDHSRVFTFWTFPEWFCCVSFQNSDILVHSRVFKSWNISWFACCEPFQKLYILDHSCIFTFKTIQYFVKFWTIPYFLRINKAKRLFGLKCIILK